MPKNLLKRNIGFPRNLKTDKTYLKHGYIHKTDLDKISMHFDNKSCRFYVYLNQLPDYIVEATKIYQDGKVVRSSGESEDMNKLIAKSVEELEQKIRDLNTAYINESSNIERKKKIAIEFKNSNYENRLNVGIEYTIFIEKIYYKADGTIDKTINVRENSSFESELKNINGEIYDYSEELEYSIKKIQAKLHDSMKDFINKLGSGKELIEAIKSHNLIENKE